MFNLIARLAEPLFRLLRPASGCPRCAGNPPPAPPPGLPGAPVEPDPPRRPSPHLAPLRGEDSRLVRPYVLGIEVTA
ncbi:hypothetical protein [Streptomyces sp. NPDC016845]|uniref:hypothetical protein n=1 Tax=Streptomyces sp. NPDC016845 TaxID=3364972 RepID=UPI0037ACBB06